MYFQLIDGVHRGAIMYKKGSLFKSYQSTENKGRSNPSLNRIVGS